MRWAPLGEGIDMSETDTDSPMMEGGTPEGTEAVEAAVMDALDAMGEAEAEAASAPFSLRQNVAANGSSCDVRIGEGALERIGRDLRIDTGRAGKLALLVEEGLDAPWLEDLEVTCTDAGFQVIPMTVADHGAEGLLALGEAFVEAGIVAGDCALAVGGAPTLSVAVQLTDRWCGGIVLGCVATSLEALVVCPATPYGLAVAGVPGRFESRPHMDLCFANPDTLPLVPGELDAKAADGLAMGRAAMVVGGVCESQDSWKTLVSRSQAIADGDLETAAQQALDGARSRARIASSTSSAVRQALGYGRLLGEGLARALEKTGQLEGLATPRARMLGEGMRIAARLAVEVCEGEVDFVFAQDALLDRLGIGEVPCDLEPALLMESIKEAARMRSRRYQFCLPYTPGRVRSMAVEDETLMAHLGGWCQARRLLKERGARD